jgi:acetyl esterase/lipase
MGHSAGAHIAALLTLDGHYLAEAGMDRKQIRGTAGLSGPYEFVPASDDRGVFGMSVTDTNPDPSIEPIHFVDGHAPPMLLLQGLKDQTVLPANTFRLAEKLRASGADVRVILYPNRAHVGVVLALAWPFRWLAPVLDDATRFFREREYGPEKSN